jgi:glutamine amidotransferase
MIAVVDYGMGNLKSVSKALNLLGFDAVVTSDRKDIEKSSGVVLPGVGAFPDCMRNLTELKLVEPVKEAAAGKPFLGICLGLQLLFEESEEFGKSDGLGIFPGRVRRFPANMMEGSEKLKIPHMGWNGISIKQKTEYLDGIAEGDHFYFVHSYYVETEEYLVATKTSYGGDFVSSIAYKNLFACQFHPEKSQRLGLKILENFGNLAEGKDKK